MSVQAFDFSIDVMRAILWRHGDAAALQKIIQNKQQAIDALNRDFWTNWLTDVFDLRTANIFGLNVWSIILDLPLIIAEDNTVVSADRFGFGPNRKNFNNGNFAPSTAKNTLLPDEARAALQLKYYKMICRPTLIESSRIVDSVMNGYMSVDVRLNEFYLDGFGIWIQYNIYPKPSQEMIAVIEENDLLPRPASVPMIIDFDSGE